MPYGPEKHAHHGLYCSRQQQLGIRKTHPDISSAVSTLKSEGMQILATNLSSTAVDFREIDYTRPTCILMGQEKHGITAEALALADQDIIIPMIGMVQSLNVSVASALILYEAQRQRQNAGMYQREHSPLSEEDQQRLLWEGGYPVLANVAKRKKLPRPRIDNEGQIDALKHGGMPCSQLKANDERPLAGCYRINFFSRRWRQPSR